MKFEMQIPQKREFERTYINMRIKHDIYDSGVILTFNNSDNSAVAEIEDSIIGKLSPEDISQLRAIAANYFTVFAMHSLFDR